MMNTTITKPIQVNAPVPVVPVGSDDNVRRLEALPPAARPAATKFTSDQLDGVVKELNDAMKVLSTTLSFSVDKETGKSIVKVIDADSGKTIRQIPSEEMMRVARRVTELLGVLFDESR